MAGGKGYAKVYRRIWTDEKFAKLDPTAKLVALYALTAQSNRIGLFRFSRAMAAEDLGISRDRLDTVWDTVCHTLFWGWDEHVSTVLIPSWWKWNAPDNESALKGYLCDLDDVPDCSLIEKFGNELRFLPTALRDTVCHTVSDRVSHTVSDTVSAPEPEPEPEPDKEPDPKKNGSAADAAFARFWEAYPKKRHKQSALSEWRKASPPLDRCLAAISEQTRWRSSGGDREFRPEWLDPERWIKRGCWDDETPETSGNGDGWPAEMTR